MYTYNRGIAFVSGDKLTFKCACNCETEPAGVMNDCHSTIQMTMNFGDNERACPSSTLTSYAYPCCKAQSFEF